MIKIENLSFHFKKKKPIFENVSFEMNAGIYGLLGENGVGKTTLLHIISGLLFPKTGSCKIFGEDSMYRRPETLSKIFYLPEEFRVPDTSIVAYAEMNGVFYPNFNKNQLLEYLSVFQVEEHKKMSEMSLGQKKKAFLSYAFALNTPILLLDEPTNGLDIPSKVQFRKIISQIGTDDKCILISTHQVRDLEHIIDPIIILDRNQVLINNTVAEITNKLYFSYTQQKPEAFLYCEQILQGYTSVQQNKDRAESILDMESLFNAVVLNKDKVKEIFKV